MKMKPLTIFTRLVIGNVIILVLILGLGIVISYDLMQLQGVNQNIIGRHQESLSGTERLIDAFERLVQFDEKFFVGRDPDYLNRFNKQQRILEQEFKTLYPLLETIDQKSGFDQAINGFQTYLAWFYANATSTQTSLQKFDTLSRQRAPVKQKIIARLNTILDATREVITQNTRRTGEMTQQILFVTVLTTLLILFTGIIITIVNTRSIENSVSRLQNKTQEISQGRFEQIKTINGPKEIQDLALHFNTMCRRLSELDDLKADFISHVSHELRTPMTSIKEAALILTKGYYSDRPEKQKQLFDLIHAECERLLKSVMRTLDFSRMEAGKMEYQREEILMPDVLRKSILKLAPLAWKKKITLEFSPPGQDIPSFFGDEDRMIEVMDNLIGNAIKFTPETGTVNVDCLAETKGTLLVRVTDNGPGIALEHLENIFYKFRQIDHELNTRMGTGLGLCISKYTIKAHGGSIWAENMEKGGTRVSFTLPVLS